MKYRSWPILVLAFGILVFLIAISGIGAMRRSRQLYEEISTLNETYRRTDAALNEVRSGIYTRSLLVRDFLMDPSAISAERYRTELRKVRRGMTRQLDVLNRFLPPRDASRLAGLNQELDAYWTDLDPLFDWSPQQRAKLSGWFLRNEVLPERQPPSPSPTRSAT